MNITPAMMYWMMRLDDIREGACGITLMFPLIGVIVLCGLTCVEFFEYKNLDESELKRIKSAKRGLWWPIPWIVVAALVNIFVPTTKQAAAIYAVPAMLNSEFVVETLPQEGRELYGMAKEWLKQQTTTTEVTK